MGLSQDQIARYSRHLLLPEVGVEGQEKLCNAKVLCIGTGVQKIKLMKKGIQ